MAAKLLTQIFSPPAFADSRLDLEARKLWAVLLSLSATVTVFFLLCLPILPQSVPRLLGYLAAYDTVFLGLLILGRRGETRAAAILLLVLTGLIVSLSAWTAGGIHAPGLMAYLLLVGLAGILRGPLTAVITGLACAGTSLFLVVAERRGFLPAPTLHHTATSIWMVFMLVMAEFVVIQVVVSWVLRHAEERSQASAVERDRTEAARREWEEKFTKVFRASPDAIIITDLETGQIIEANAGYEKLFGYARSELIGRTTVELGIFDDPAERRALVEAVRAGHGVRDREMVARSRRGEPIPLLFSGELVELGAGTCMVSIIHDLTRRKQAEGRERQARDDFTRKLIGSQESERRRIAAELHDSLGQNLILIKNRAQLGLELATASPALQAQFTELQTLAAQAIAEVRQISHDLRPYQLDQLGLTRALETLVNAAAKNSKCQFAHKLDPVDDLFSPEAATHLYRVAQECIGNLLKHAGAGRAHVALERDIRDVRLRIEDDGQGFAAPASADAPGSGFGLGGIAERVRILGGVLRLDSAPQRGTRIEVVIPHAGRP